MTTPLKKFEINALTGKSQLVDLTPEEMAEAEARQARAKAAQEADTAAQAESEAQTVADQQILGQRPTDEAIRDARSITALSDLMLKQNAVMAVLIKRMGLDK